VAGGTMGSAATGPRSIPIVWGGSGGGVDGATFGSSETVAPDGAATGGASRCGGRSIPAHPAINRKQRTPPIRPAEIDGPLTRIRADPFDISSGITPLTHADARVPSRGYCCSCSAIDRSCEAKQLKPDPARISEWLTANARHWLRATRTRWSRSDGQWLQRRDGGHPSDARQVTLPAEPDV